MELRSLVIFNFPLPLPWLQAFLCSLYVYWNLLFLYYMKLTKFSRNAHTDRSYYKYLPTMLLFSVPCICSNILSWTHSVWEVRIKILPSAFLEGISVSLNTYDSASYYFMETSSDDVNTVNQKHPSTTAFKPGLQTETKAFAWGLWEETEVTVHRWLFYVEELCEKLCAQL